MMPKIFHDEVKMLYLPLIFIYFLIVPPSRHYCRMFLLCQLHQGCLFRALTAVNRFSTKITVSAVRECPPFEDYVNGGFTVFVSLDMVLYLTLLLRLFALFLV